jgi:hypothetical protein
MTTIHNAGTLDNREVYHCAAVEGILPRITGKAPQGTGRELAALSWPDLHCRHLRQAGQSVARLSDIEGINRALTTSRLLTIAGEAMNLSIPRIFDAAMSPSALLGGSSNNPDFRESTEALVNWTMLAVDKVTETGGYRYTCVAPESGKKYKLSPTGGMAPPNRSSETPRGRTPEDLQR